METPTLADETMLETLPKNALGTNSSDKALKAKDSPECVPEPCESNSKNISIVTQGSDNAPKCDSTLLDIDQADQGTNVNVPIMVVPNEENENSSSLNIDDADQETDALESNRDVSIVGVPNDESENSSLVNIGQADQETEAPGSNRDVSIVGVPNDESENSSLVNIGQADQETEAPGSNRDVPIEMVPKEETENISSVDCNGVSKSKTEDEQEEKMEEDEKETNKKIDSILQIPEKTNEQGKQRYGLRSKGWSKKNDETFYSLVRRSGGTSWAKVSPQIKNRTEKERPEKCHKCSETTKDGKGRLVWTEEDDKIIKEAVLKQGPKWEEISRLLPGRSIFAARDRWYRVLKPKRDSDDFGQAHVKRKSPLKVNHSPISVTATSSSEISSNAIPLTATSSTATSSTAISSSTSIPAVISASEAQPAGVNEENPSQVEKDQENPQPTLSVGDQEKNRKALLEQLVILMPDQWVSRVSVDGAYALRWAPGVHCAVQRAVYASFDGLELKISVHSHTLSPTHEVYDNPIMKPPVCLSKNTVADFAKVIMSGVMTVQEYKLCAGLETPEFVDYWTEFRECRLDENLYREGHWKKTLRTTNCEYLIPFRKKRCESCQTYFAHKRNLSALKCRLKNKKNKKNKKIVDVVNVPQSKPKIEESMAKVADQQPKGFGTRPKRNKRKKFQTDDQELEDDEDSAPKPKKNKLEGIVPVSRKFKNDEDKTEDVVLQDNVDKADKNQLEGIVTFQKEFKRVENKTEVKQDNVDVRGLTLQERVAKLVAAESIPVDKQLVRDLEHLFKNAEGVIKLIWEEQVNVNAAKKFPMKWHPLALRWALKKKSAGTDVGCIRLSPHRMLYEYFNGGVEDQVVKRIADVMGRFEDDFSKCHVLVFDEMCVMKNIVYNKATGRITGYLNLAQVEDEIAMLEDGRLCFAVATTMLTFFVKGVASGVRGVVAGFPIEGVLNEDILHKATWDVIWELEVTGAKVIALVGDGSALTQAFFNRHSPITKTTSGVVFDTVNIYAKGRPIYFFNDVGSILKLIRNCFANSGAHKKSRALMKNGESITWKTVVKVFASGLHSFHKLKGVHVFLNSHSVTETFVAAQAMSESVASCIQRNNIPDTVETVKFIRFVNDFYDCLNGSLDKPRNDNLGPYQRTNDRRFAFLIKFLHYLEEWKVEVDSLPIPEAEKQKRKLSAQTLTGIERTIKSFIAAVTFMLDQRTDPDYFVVAKMFQLDP